MNEILAFSRSSGIYEFMHSTWGWPFIESLHFLGLCLLLGTVGVYDLRLLGIGRAIPAAALHQLVPFGVAGFSLNVATGLLFFLSAPDQYAFNPAFQLKMLFIAVAGCNMLAFNLLAWPRIKAGSISRQGLLFGAVSLTCWLAVIVMGRLITYYRPPYFWCLWC